MQQEDKKGFLAKLSDNTKASIFRWWFVGAIYLFIGFGTNIALSNKAEDLIFALGLACGIANIFIYNPIVYGMFEIERRGKLVNKKYYERTVIEGSLAKLLEIVKCLFVVFLVYLTYTGLNMAIVTLLNKHKDTTTIPGEPILFTTFFLFYYNLTTFIINKFYDFKEKRITKNINKEGDRHE